LPAANFIGQSGRRKKHCESLTENKRRM